MRRSEGDCLRVSAFFDRKFNNNSKQNGKDMETIDGSLLKLPECPIPRPGEKVSWYEDARLVNGDLTGYDKEGRPLIITEFGNPAPRDVVDKIRLRNPFDRRGPNWRYLPINGLIIKPNNEILQRINNLLNNPIPPGPSAYDLAREIWNRGFEIYLVGGTVRDVLRGSNSNDIDFVTTMPLVRCAPLISSMFRYNPSSRPDRGFIRIGGKPASGDPFIDLKIFSDSLLGTEAATFGVGFDRDIGHRDFACNAVYFDPINEVLVDPTGIGITDSIEGRLTLICNSGDLFQQAQIFLRFFKFCSRGFMPTESTSKEILDEYAKSVSCMKKITKIRYFQAQILSKCRDSEKYRSAVIEIQNMMTSLGAGDVWNQHFEPIMDEIFKYEQ